MISFDRFWHLRIGWKEYIRKGSFIWCVFLWMCDREPAEVVTVYRTSKMSKYWKDIS